MTICRLHPWCLGLETLGKAASSSTASLLLRKPTTAFYCPGAMPPPPPTQVMLAICQQQNPRTTTHTVIFFGGAAMPLHGGSRGRKGAPVLCPTSLSSHYVPGHSPLQSRALIARIGLIKASQGWHTLSFSALGGGKRQMQHAAQNRQPCDAALGASRSRRRPLAPTSRPYAGSHPCPTVASWPGPAYTGMPKLRRMSLALPLRFSDCFRSSALLRPTLRRYTWHSKTARRSTAGRAV